MAALQGDKGKDMMMNSSAAEKMKDDPRFRAAMGLNWFNLEIKIDDFRIN